MSLYLTELHRDKADRVNANPSNSDFNRAFLSAVREVLMDIRNLGYVVPTFPQSHDAEIENIDERYVPVVSAGVDWYLHLRSEWKQADDGARLERTYEKQLRRTPTIYFNDSPPVGRYGDLDA
jgi:hypothetical protein